MNTRTTITMDAQGDLLTVRVRGFADEIREGSRVLDAIGAEGTRVGARRALVDVRDLDGAILPAHHAEFERLASVRLARLKCAVVIPPDCGGLGKVPTHRARFGVFASPSAALEWLHGRVAQAPPAGRAEHTLVHLI